MHSPTILRLLALAVLAAGAAAAWAGDDCDAPPENWQPRSAVHALAERKGWRVQALKIDDGCYEVKGREADGRRFKATIDPATLQVLKLKRERQRAAHESTLQENAK